MSNTSFLKRLDWSKLCNYLALGLVILGVLVRLVQYWSNRSLWGDEVSLALNIIDRSYGELSQPLDHNQAAPLGFLWVEKLATQIGGNSEYALRLLPFIASIVSLSIFYRLVRRYSSALAAPIAIALFAGGRYTLYFATELKPYSSDLAIALSLFWLLTSAHQRILPVKTIISFAVLGGLAIWFSYPSIFVLAGLAGWNLVTAEKKYLAKILINRSGIYLTWLVSFGLFYFLTIANTLSNEDLNSSWESRYPDSFGDIIWLFDALGRFFYHPMGFVGVTDGIGIFAFIVGCIVWYRRNRTIFLALIAPFVATIIAAYLHKYPFRDRLILFLAPLGTIIVAEGIAFMLVKLSRVNRANTPKFTWLFGLLGIVCLCALTFPAIYRAGNLIIHPELKHEVKPVLSYVAQHNRPGDKIYVYEEGSQAFTYYVQLKNYSDLDYIYGTVNFSSKEQTLSAKLRELSQDLQELKNRPVWFILRADPPEELEILRYLDRIGQQQDAYKHTGASAYLYDLNNFN